jgi:hypothetical protein
VLKTHDPFPDVLSRIFVAVAQVRMCKLGLLRAGVRNALAVLNLTPSFVVVCIFMNPSLDSAQSVERKKN